MFQRRVLIAIICGICLLLKGNLLPANEGEVDSREQCRSIVSGTYLRFLNDLDVLKDNLTSTGQTVFAMRAKRKLSEQKLRALERKAEALQTPAAELDEGILGTRYELATTDDEIREADARMASLKDQIAVKEQAFAHFKSAMDFVFEPVNARIVSQGAYPLRLQFRHPCSKYKQLCALPDDHAAALTRLAKELDDAIPCEHYANLHI